VLDCATACSNVPTSRSISYSKGFPSRDQQAIPISSAFLNGSSALLSTHLPRTFVFILKLHQQISNVETLGSFRATYFIPSNLSRTRERSRAQRGFGLEPETRLIPGVPRGAAVTRTRDGPP